MSRTFKNSNRLAAVLAIALLAGCSSPALVEFGRGSHAVGPIRVTGNDTVLLDIPAGSFVNVLP